METHLLHCASFIREGAQSGSETLLEALVAEYLEICYFFSLIFDTLFKLMRDTRLRPLIG